MQIGAATVENSMEFPQKVELPFDPAIPLLGLYPKNPETPIQKIMHLYIHSSIIYNSQDLEAAEVSTDRGMDEEDVV